MDTEFWASIANNDYAIPDGHSLENLTEILFGYLRSTDPVLRDDIAYAVYANWLKREMYTREVIQSQVDTLLSNLEKDIGETESDTVFLRAFAVLFLAEIVHNDNKKPLLDKATVKQILDKGLWYLNAEQDPRGHVPVKGWAHALAHTADLLLVLGCNAHLQEADLWMLLTGIADKMTHATRQVYIHGEDERLASAVIEILRRDLVSLNQLEAWAKAFLRPDGKDWNGALADQERNHAYQNTRNLLRSIYLGLLMDSDEMPERESLQRLFLNTLTEFKPY